MMKNEYMERLHPEPDGNATPEPAAEALVVPEASEESVSIGEELLAVLDVILGVNTDGG